MFALNAEHYYRVPEWGKYDWLEHGFGTIEAGAAPENLATVKQIHSSEVFIADHKGLQGTGDGLISNAKGLMVGVKTADCLPILLVDPHHRVVAAVHAGWRGSAAGIVRRSVDILTSAFGVDSTEMEAAIGPGIGTCCFEVGPEVAREFGPWETEEKTCLDLVGINSSQLRAAGLQKIYTSGLCTKCGNGFFSFRRDGEKAGRMISYVGLKQ